MKSNLSWAVLIALFTVFTGCENKQKKAEQEQSDQEIESFLEMAFAEPDIYFEVALQNFEDGDFENAAENLSDAIFFIQELNFEEDTANAPILDFAVMELEELQNDLTESKVDSVNVLTNTFASVNTSIASYHLAIVEDHFKNGGEQKEGLERLHRALIRLDHAIAYQNYALSYEEQVEIETIRNLIAEAEKSSPRLLKRENTLFERITKRFESKN